jgi:hypothetical protein
MPTLINNKAGKQQDGAVGVTLLTKARALNRRKVLFSIPTQRRQRLDRFTALQLCLASFSDTVCNIASRTVLPYQLFLHQFIPVEPKLLLGHLFSSTVTPYLEKRLQSPVGSSKRSKVECVSVTGSHTGADPKFMLKPLEESIFQRFFSVKTLADNKTK